MALVYLIPALVLVAGGLLLGSRERIVKTAGVVLLSAGPLLLLWMGQVMQKVTDVTSEQKDWVIGFLILTCVYVMAAWMWFFVSLRRLEKQENELLSSIGQQDGEANEPREQD